MKELSHPCPPNGLTPRRLCLAADVEQYSRLDTRTQCVVQSELVRLLDEAAASAGLDRATWTRQPQGDLEFAVLPELTPEGVVLGPLVHHLAARLGEHNARPGTVRIRLRLSVDTGVALDAALGHAGPAPVAVARYLDAPQLRSVLANLTTAHLAAIVSDRLYQDVVRAGWRDLDPAQYMRVHVQVKEFGGYGWIRVPGHGPDEMRSALAKAPGHRPASPNEGDTPSRTALSQHVHQGAAVGGDVVGGLTVGLPVPPPPPGPWPVR
ncbi:hypothetical protein ACIPSE_40390 [Streptomyces sp. NPDC090106]|uniref:hypothetical protein n=1 Tax=Streptomyces sp. NPDC090106 TaxID=3365946 RepID=UPI00381DECAF